MNIQLYLAPTSEPVILSELKLHLRIEPDETDEDEYLEEMIKTAREQVEQITRRALLTQTWDYYLPGWPRCNFIKLPYGNLASVTSLAWKDDGGTSTTLTVTTDYLVETNGEGLGRIVLPYAVSWPNGTLYPSNPISIRYICGWTAASEVPFKIKTAVKMLCAKWYESRGEDMLAVTIHEDQTVMALLSSYRLWDECL